MEYLYYLYIQTPQPSTSNVKFEYSLKIVNPEKMSICACWCLNAIWVLKILDDKASASTDISKPDFQHVEIGYIIPGHGLKGKKIWLLTDIDLREMCETLQGKKSIQLWGYTHVTTKPPQNKGSSVGSSSSTNSTNGQKSSEVDQIYEQLREKHKENHMYDEERLRMWAYLIKMGKHASLEEPPDKPFWRGCKRPATEAERQVTTKMRVVSSSSPSTKVSMRTFENFTQMVSLMMGSTRS